MDQASKLRDLIQKAREQVGASPMEDIEGAAFKEREAEPMAIATEDALPQQMQTSAKARTQKARVITVTSGKGGVGKSNISVNLAVQFQKQGKKVVIFDADFGLANVEVIFGILPKYNILDLIHKKMSIFDTMTEGPLGIQFLSGGSGIGQLLNLSTDQIEYLVKQLEILDQHADIIIIDTGAGISEAVLAFAFVSGEVLVVTTPEPTAITDAYALIKSICNNPQFQQSKPRIRLIVNKSRTVRESDEVFEKLNKVTERFLDISLEKLGYLPDDRALVDAVIERKPFSIIYPKAAVTKGIEEIAMRLLMENQAEDKKEPQPKGLSAIFSKLFHRK